jgi:type VI secretion system protein
MSRELTLFERMRSPESAFKRTIKEDEEKLFHSVLEHLQKVLNSRQGHALIQPDYGMPDFTDFKYSLPESVLEMETIIKNTIEKYEPRLKNVQVKFIPMEKDSDPLTIDRLFLNFEIKADLVSKDEEYEATFNTIINAASGNIKVHG